MRGGADSPANSVPSHPPSSLGRPAEKKARQNHKIITMSKFKRQLAKEGLLDEEERESYRRKRRRPKVRAHHATALPRPLDGDEESVFVGVIRPTSGAVPQGVDTSPGKGEVAAAATDSGARPAGPPSQVGSDAKASAGPAGGASLGADEEGDPFFSGPAAEAVVEDTAAKRRRKAASGIGGRGRRGASDVERADAVSAQGTHRHGRLSRPPKQDKAHPYAAALEEARKKKLAEEETQRKRRDVEGERKRKEKERHHWKRKLSQRTKRGQPVLSNQMDRILAKLQNA